MTDDEIISESFLFFFAGFDTSSSTTTFAVWELTHHPEYQDKVRQEINDVLAKHNGELTYDALSEMTYLDMVIRGNCLKTICYGMTNYAIFRNFEVVSNRHCFTKKVYQKLQDSWYRCYC